MELTRDNPAFPGLTLAVMLAAVMIPVAGDVGERFAGGGERPLYVLVIPAADSRRGGLGER
jgi:hypothetical protein